MLEQMKAINVEMAFHSEKKKEVQQKYLELVEELQWQKGDMTEIFEEREKINMLIRERIKPHFGNAGAVNSLMGRVKEALAARGDARSITMADLGLEEGGVRRPHRFFRV